MTKLLAFVHIPKCAGTHITSSVMHHRIRIVDHIESYYHNNKFDEIQQFVRNGYIISGHITIPAFMGIANRFDIEPFFFTSFRHPASQLLSQLNWQMETALKGLQFLKAHPNSALEVIRKIILCDHKNPSSVLDIIDQHPGYFLNNQSTFMIGNLDNAVNRDHSPDALSSRIINRIDSLTLGCAEDGYQRIIDSLVIHGISDDRPPEPSIVSGKNNSHNFFRFPNSATCQYFINELVKRQHLDNRLYEHISSSDAIAMSLEALYFKTIQPIDPSVQGLINQAQNTLAQLDASELQISN